MGDGLKIILYLLNREYNNCDSVMLCSHDYLEYCACTCHAIHYAGAIHMQVPYHLHMYVYFLIM